MNAVECRMESMECDEEADRALLQFKFSEANKWREEARQSRAEARRYEEEADKLQMRADKLN